MNPDSTRVKPLGIEVEFDRAEHALVAHIPGRAGGSVFWLVDETNRLGSEQDLSRLDRAFIRAMLTEALRRLDDTEPSNPNAVAR